MLMPEISYQFYFDVFCCGKKGKTPPEDFDFNAKRATEEIAMRLCTSPSEEQADAVRLAICEVCDLLYTHSSKTVKSESIDGYSVTYSDSLPLTAQINHIIQKHLFDNGLLFRGVQE